MKELAQSQLLIQKVWKLGKRARKIKQELKEASKITREGFEETLMFMHMMT